MPVELDVALAERPPLAVDTAANFVIAEALANVTGIFSKLGVSEAPVDHRCVQAVLAFLRR